ncbi:hypothetical protein [Kribbella ginsengisoli]|uniref:hypothetical protein n=1 Tax=Kribbella ginsengisoli TaxID=363865 RepID=UPI0031DDE638
MTTRTRVAALAATLPLLFGAAACGAAPTAEQPAQTKPAAPVKAAPPLRLTSATFAPALNRATAKVTSFEGVGHITAQGQTLAFTAAVTAKPLAMSMEMSGAALGGSSVRMLMVERVVYMSAPGVTPAGKYVVLDLTKDKNPQVRAVGRMLANADPLKQFKSWKPGGQKVEFVGTDKLDDLAVEHYRVSTVLGGKPIVFDLWMGADNLLHKMAYTFSGMDYVMTMTGYNTVAPIAAPAASEIVKQR